jgi:DNA-binding SARP family transcriptional activator
MDTVADRALLSSAEAKPDELLSALRRLTERFERAAVAEAHERTDDAGNRDVDESDRFDEAEVVAALETFLQSHERYQRARDAVREASQAVAVAEADRHVRLVELRRVLAGASERATPLAPARDQADSPVRPNARALRLPALEITCFGRFEVRRSGRKLELCASRNGQAILRFLVAQPRRQASMDILIETLWPDEPARVARHKLHCAFSALRHALNRGTGGEKGGGYLLCENGAYLLNPAAEIQTDADQFMALYQAGQRAGEAAAVPHFEAACRLYGGPYLAEDLYADWSQIRREQLTQARLAMCGALAQHHLASGNHDDAAAWAMQVLEENRCDESAYRLLIRAHAAAGRRGRAIQQYRLCERILAEELAVEPMPETRAAFEEVLTGARP